MIRGETSVSKDSNEGMVDAFKVGGKLTLGNASFKQTLLLCLNVEADLGSGRVMQRKSALNSLADAAVAEFDAVLGQAGYNCLARRQLRRIHH